MGNTASQRVPETAGHQAVRGMVPSSASMAAAPKVIKNATTMIFNTVTNWMGKHPIFTVVLLAGTITVVVIVAVPTAQAAAAAAIAKVIAELGNVVAIVVQWILKGWAWLKGVAGGVPGAAAIAGVAGVASLAAARVTYKVVKAQCQDGNGRDRELDVVVRTDGPVDEMKQDSAVPYGVFIELNAQSQVMILKALMAVGLDDFKTVKPTTDDSVYGNSKDAVCTACMDKCPCIVYRHCKKTALNGDKPEGRQYHYATCSGCHLLHFAYRIAAYLMNQVEKGRVEPETLLTRTYVENFVANMSLCCGGCNDDVDKVYLDPAAASTDDDITCVSKK